MFGLDLNSLPGQFDGFSNGRTLIIDGDAAIYKSAAVTSSIETAKRRFVQEILTLQFLAKAQFIRIHLTSRNSYKAGRFEVQATKPYQGNREGTKKPPLVEPLRQVVAARRLDMPDDWYVELHSHYEADDGCIIDAYNFKNSGIIFSEDKDLRMTPFPFLDPKTNSVLPDVTGIGRLWIHQKSKSKTLLGHGPIFFWAQMLMGDTADHIAGLTRYKGKLCGPVKTYELLEEFQEQPDEKAVARFVLDAYSENKQDPVPEGKLLWLYRTADYCFETHLKELAL